MARKKKPKTHGRRRSETPGRGRLFNKVTMITGAARGIGLACAFAAAREGAVVVLSDIDIGAAEDAAQAIRTAGGKASAVELDVTSEESWVRVVAAVVRKHKRLDALVNNAGVALGGPIVDTNLEDWRWVMSVNLDGMFLGTKHAFRAMRRSGGAIVNVCSALAAVGRPLTGAVSASKAGALLLTRTAALESAAREYGIRVNAVLPGGVDTEIFKGQSWWPDHRTDPRREAHARHDIVSDTPLGRLATPEEVANAVVFLASDEASFITGASLAIDGGFTAA